MIENVAKLNTLIVGGGLAGISAAYHLKDRSSLLIEKSDALGGTARSFKLGAFTFDFTGHLLHLHFPYTKKLIRKVLKNNFYECVRKAKIFSNKTYTNFPYQANTQGLPEAVSDQCVLGFLETTLNNRGKKIDFSKLNFEQWCRSIFGKGISEHFMLPYNEKLYQVPGKRMTVDWCGKFVPKVTLEEVIRGALVEQKGEFGYNTKFIYPKKGGIEVLAQTLGKNLKNVSLSTTIKKLDWKNKKATLSNGRSLSYTNLVNSIPLKNFLSLFSELPVDVRNAQKKLKCVGILCLNIGIKRARISDASWIYFPESKYPFYRVGFPMNFTPHVVPKGCSSMYVEVPLSLSRSMSSNELIRSVKNGLVDAGILRESDEWLVTQFLPIPFAYVIYDKYRDKALKTIFNFFERNSIQTIGRYGAWKYSFMEEAIMDGKMAADKILGKN